MFLPFSGSIPKESQWDSRRCSAPVCRKVLACVAIDLHIIQQRVQIALPAGIGRLAVNGDETGEIVYGIELQIPVERTVLCLDVDLTQHITARRSIQLYSFCCSIQQERIELTIALRFRTLSVKVLHPSK